MFYAAIRPVNRGCAYRLDSALRQIVILRAVPADNGAPGLVGICHTPGYRPVTLLQAKLLFGEPELPHPLAPPMGELAAPLGAD